MSRKRPQVEDSESEDNSDKSEDEDDEVDEPAAPAAETNKTNKTKRRKTSDTSCSSDDDEEKEEKAESKEEKVVDAHDDGEGEDDDNEDDDNEGEGDDDENEDEDEGDEDDNVPLQRQKWCTGWEAEEDHHWYPYLKNDRIDLKPQSFPAVHNFHTDLNESRKQLWEEHLQRVRDSTKKLADAQASLRLSKYEEAVKIGLRATSTGASISCPWKKEWADSFNAWLTDIKIAITSSVNPLAGSGQEQIVLDVSQNYELILLRRHEIPPSERAKLDVGGLYGSEQQDTYTSHFESEDRRTQLLGESNLSSMLDEFGGYNGNSNYYPGYKEVWVCFLKHKQKEKPELELWNCLPKVSELTGVYLALLPAISSTTTTSSSSWVPFNLWVSKFLELLLIFDICLVNPAKSITTIDGFSRKLHTAQTGNNFHNYCYFPFHSFPSAVISDLTYGGNSDDAKSVSEINLSDTKTLDREEVKTLQLSPLTLSAPLVPLVPLVPLGTWIDMDIPRLLLLRPDMHLLEMHKMRKACVSDTMIRGLRRCSLIPPAIIEKWRNIYNQLTFSAGFSKMDNFYWTYNVTEVSITNSITHNDLSIHRDIPQMHVFFNRLGKENNKMLGITPVNGINGNGQWNKKWAELIRFSEKKKIKIPAPFLEVQEHLNQLIWWMIVTTKEVAKILFPDIGSDDWNSSSSNSSCADDFADCSVAVDDRNISELLATKTSLGKMTTMLERVQDGLMNTSSAPIPLALMDIVGQYAKIGYPTFDQINR